MKALLITSVASVGLHLLISAPAEAAVLYQAVDLGTVGGAFRSEARGITQDGEVWGENFNTKYPYFLWFNNTNHGIALPSEVSAMSLYGMNADMKFAGYFSYTVSARNFAFFGSPTRPESLGQANFSPRGVNFRGDVVGITTINVEYYPGSPLVPANRPAVVRGGKLTILPSLAGSNVWNDAEATAINDNGIIVGWSHTSSKSSPANVVHAFLWDGTMHDLHTLPTLTNSYAIAVNNNNMVVGYRKNSAFSANEPFYWTVASNMVAMPVPGGYGSAQPLGLNNRGDIVGVADSSAVVWTNGVMTDLQTVIPPSPSWDLDGAYGINDAGQIVGYGKNGGLTKGFLLQPTNVPVAQFKIELLDPGDPSASNALTGFSLTTDTAILNSLSVHRVVVAADGATRLLARFSTTNHGTVALSLRAADGASGVTGNPQEDGGVGNAGGTRTPVPDRYDTSTVNTAEGIRAYALYHTPAIFHRTNTDDSTVSRRVINLQAVFTPNSGSSVTQVVAIAIVRPPVIVMHGLWSDRPDSFGGFELTFEQEEHGVQIFGPSYPNAISFASNASVLPKAFGDAIGAYHDQNYACTRADIFSHSMGGVLSRIHAGRADYQRPENYGLGDINRLVTIDSPHRGSFFGDAIKRTFNWLDAYGMSAIHGWLADKMTEHKMPPELGAGDDLLTTSLAISNMNQRATTVAAHVIVGDFEVSEDYDLTTLPQPLGGFYELLDMVGVPGQGPRTLFFSPLPGTDLIVSTDSQNAGMTGNATTTYGHQHVGAATNNVVVAKCLSLFRKPPSSDQYSVGFPTGWTSTPWPPLPSAPAWLLQIIEGAVNLVFNAGPSANSGTTVSISVSEPAGTNFNSVLLLTRDAALTHTNAPFDFMLPIPSTAVGDYPVTYCATDAASNLWWGTKVLSVTPLAALNYLEASPRRFIFTRLGDQEQIAVTGVYYDMARDVTDPSTGTTYSSDNTNIVSVSSNGMMTALAAGTAQITITNSGKLAFVDIVVNPSPSPDLALGETASATNVTAGATVTFTLRVTNVGPQTATGVYLAHTLPADAQFQSATSSQGAWSFVNGTFAAGLETLAPGGAALATVTVSFTNGGAHIGTAAVSSLGLDANDADNEATVVVNVTAPLMLAIRLAGTNVVISWPTNAMGYELERAPDLASPPPWETAATNPPIVGDHYELSLPPTNAPVYFRLRHP